MKKEDLRIIFMGTPEFAVETLRQLVEGGYNVVAVVTQPDKPVGRHGSVLQPSDVKRYALQKGLPVLQPVKMKDEAFINELASYKADLQVVVAFRMLPEVVWSMPHFGTFNVHAALLPQYRGAAPINWAIINGEKVTGVTTFFLDKDIDTGRIIIQRKFNIPDDADVEFVYNGLMSLGAQVALETINKVIETDGKVESMPQLEEGTLKPAPKIFKETCHIDWYQSANDIYNFVRGLSPYPGSWSYVESLDGSEKQVLKIYNTLKTNKVCEERPGSIMVEKNRMFVATEDEWLEIVILQLSGKRRMTSADFINGYKDIRILK
jgi:methionyl-tRNA formyltransferase